MKWLNVLLGLMAAAATSFASVHDLHFRSTPQEEGLLVGSSNYSICWLNSNGERKVDAHHDEVRIRVIDPPASDAAFGFDLERPFLILDGIYLNPKEERTLSSLQDEVDQIGMISLLKSLGYTPVLVQFSETVTKDIEYNADKFSKLLQFLNDNQLVGFRNRMEDGFIVMGISQGGIIGRYGSYVYDRRRTIMDAPIRLYASLDSPHQGAVMPKGLAYTLDFWATVGGSADAEKFRDMVENPGASDLLLYQKIGTPTGPMADIYGVDTSSSRFLFGKYRDAAEYNGFPAVLVAQGQMKGESPDHASNYYELSRYAERLSIVFGRVSSFFSPTNSVFGHIEGNRLYKKWKINAKSNHWGAAPMDFVQGSTYPFARTIYTNLRDGFLEKMPDKLDVEMMSGGGYTVYLNLKSHWEKDTLYQANSTFIPTVSAMDLKCNGELAIGQDCAFTENYRGFPFENPKTRSSADAVFAVDSTHPRFAEPISGRHIELPGQYESLDTLVLRGMQTDIWRLLCEVAKYDYDDGTKSYRNENLSGVFVPGASCMDLSKMPDLIKNSGLVQWRRFGYVRYDYNQTATEADELVGFTVPAGWHKVASYSVGGDIPEGTSFETEIKVNQTNGGWLKAELLLTKDQGGAGQIQLQEIPVLTDGKSHVVRWSMPAASGSLSNYKWIRLVVNSDGADLEVSSPRLVYAQKSSQALNKISSNILYPSKNFAIRNWSGEVAVNSYQDAIGSGMELKFETIGSNVFVNFGETKDLSKYSKLKISYWPGTCQNTRTYFDSYVTGAQNLSSQILLGGFVEKVLPLESVINTNYTPDNGLSASKLFLRGSVAGERCIVNRIALE